MTAPLLTRYIQGQGSCSADNLNTFAQTCDTVAQLRAFIGTVGVEVLIRGLTAPNDGGAGAFYWNALGTGPDDGVNTIVPTGAAIGCWSRLVTLAVGQQNIYGFSTTTALLSAFSNTVVLPNGTMAQTAGRTSVGDGGGATFYYNSADTSSPDNGGTIRVDGAGRRWYAEIGLEVSVCLFGVVPNTVNGAVDTGMAQAFAWQFSQTTTPGPTSPTGLGSSQQQPILFWPPGNYTYGGTGVVGPSSASSIVGMAAIPDSMSLTLLQNVYFLTMPGFVSNSLVRGMHIIGGKGAVQYTFAGAMVGGLHVYEDCVFEAYTECAFGNAATDSPYLKVARCQFLGALSGGTCGIAWGGYCDNMDIHDNAFIRNKFHLKIGPKISGSIAIERNDFLRDTVGVTTADIWIVPNSTDSGGANSGFGFGINQNRFGNENQGNTDIRILVALENTASGTRQTYPPLLVYQNVTSGAYLTGLLMLENRIVAPGAVSVAFMQSYINEFRSLIFRDNINEGGSYTYLCQFMGAWTASYTNTRWDVDLGPSDPEAGAPLFALGVSNFPVGAVQDRQGYLQTGAGVLFSETSLGDDAGFLLLGQAAGSDIVLVGATKTSVTDKRGASTTATTGAEVTLTANGLSSLAVVIMSAGTANTLSWVEVDLQRGAANSLPNIYIQVSNTGDGNIALVIPAVVLPTSWTTLRIPFILPASAAPTDWQLQFYSNSWVTSTAIKFQIANVNVYQAKQPVNASSLSCVGVNAGGWNGPLLQMGGSYLWIDTSGRLRIKSSAPTSATDGTVVGTQS